MLTDRLSFTVPAEMGERLQAIAAERGLTMSALVREMLAKGLPHFEAIAAKAKAVQAPRRSRKK